MRRLLTFYEHAPIMEYMGIAIKRIYEEPAASDGFRVLVDRLWPRGMTKERAALDLWLKAVSPSPSLRKWFGHDPAKFAEFQARYVAELDANTAVEDLRCICAEHPDVTLLLRPKTRKSIMPWYCATISMSHFNNRQHKQMFKNDIRFSRRFRIPKFTPTACVHPVRK